MSSFNGLTIGASAIISARRIWVKKKKRNATICFNVLIVLCVSYVYVICFAISSFYTHSILLLFWPIWYNFVLFNAWATCDTFFGKFMCNFMDWVSHTHSHTHFFCSPLTTILTYSRIYKNYIYKAALRTEEIRQQNALKEKRTHGIQINHFFFK